MTELVLAVRQIRNYPQESTAGALDAILVQPTSLGAPYAYINAPDLVSTALLNGSPLQLKPGSAIAWNGGQLTYAGGAFAFNAPVTMPSLSAPVMLLAGDAVATQQFVTDIFAHTAVVNTFNGRSGDVALSVADVMQAGALPQTNPHMNGVCTAPTIWNPQDASDLVATTAFVQSAVCDFFNTGRQVGSFVASFNGRGGDVIMTASDVTIGATQPTQYAQANTPPFGDYSRRIATTAFVGDVAADIFVTLAQKAKGTIPQLVSATTAVVTSSSVIIAAPGTCTLTLPSPASSPGQWLYLKSTNPQVVQSSSANIIPLAGGAATTAIFGAFAPIWVNLQSDGTNWITFNTAVLT
jgi:hypothetical protein